MGDNDMLSSRVARLLGTDLLVLMSTIDGLISPETNEVIAEITNIDSVLGFLRVTIEVSFLLEVWILSFKP